MRKVVVANMADDMELMPQGSKKKVIHLDRFRVCYKLLS